jgi:hypothetical protein
MATDIETYRVDIDIVSRKLFCRTEASTTARDKGGHAMTDPPPYPDAYPDMGDEPGDRGLTATPRWVKVFGIIALVLVLLVGILLVAGGDHGPGRHTSPGDAGGQTPPSKATESGGGGGGHKPPAGGHTP